MKYEEAVEIGRRAIGIAAGEVQCLPKPPLSARTAGRRREGLGARAPCVFVCPVAETGFAGFTLIELLVVIAIIALLAAMLLPTLYRAKMAANTVACKNNLHQFSLALEMYSDDSNEGYPPFVFRPSPFVFRVTSPRVGFSGSPFWSGLLSPYLQSAATGGHSVFMCPSFVRLPGAAPSNLMDTFGDSPLSYAYNASGFGGFEQSGFGAGLGLGSEEPLPNPPDRETLAQVRPVRQSEVVSPSAMLAIGDAPLDDMFQPKLAISSNLSLATEPSYLADNLGLVNFPSSLHTPMIAAKDVRTRHGGRWNVICCDGHAETFGAGNLLDYRSDALLKRWNRDHLPHRENVPASVYPAAWRQ